MSTFRDRVVDQLAAGAELVGSVLVLELLRMGTCTS